MTWGWKMSPSIHPFTHHMFTEHLPCAGHYSRWAVNKTDKDPCLHRGYNSERETGTKQGSILTQSIGEKYRILWVSNRWPGPASLTVWADREGCIGTNKRPERKECSWWWTQHVQRPWGSRGNEPLGALQPGWWGAEHVGGIPCFWKGPDCDAGRD